MNISTPEQLDDVIRNVLGFAPSDSFVVVPIAGQGPFARVDLDSEEVLAETFATALRHWDNVVVAYYGEAPFFNLDTILPGVTVVAEVHLPNPPAEAFTRDGLATLAAFAETAEEAEREARNAYAKGDGALAWAYLDRAETLAGGLSAMGVGVAMAMRAAVNPLPA